MDADNSARIAVFAGPTATILNSPPLVTSNLARRIHGLPLQTDPQGRPLRFDGLRPQRLAKPVTVYVEQFSAHPLEREGAHLYGPPDGWLDGFRLVETVPGAAGASLPFSHERSNAARG